MTCCTRARTGVLVMLLAAGSAGMAAEPDVPGPNPFARPSRPPASAAAEPSAPSSPMFGLRATMAAGADSLANVDGEILELGDVFAGYRLVAVGEGTAVFLKNGVRYSIQIDRESGD